VRTGAEERDSARPERQTRKRGPVDQQGTEPHVYRRLDGGQRSGDASARVIGAQPAGANERLNEQRQCPRVSVYPIAEKVITRLGIRRLQGGGWAVYARTNGSSGASQRTVERDASPRAFVERADGGKECVAELRHRRRRNAKECQRASPRDFAPRMGISLGQLCGELCDGSIARREAGKVASTVNLAKDHQHRLARTNNAEGAGDDAAHAMAR